MYQSITQLAKTFGLSRTTVYRKVEGIKAEIGKRYNRYAILENRISAAVFADYLKYESALNDSRIRNTVPPFDADGAAAYLGGCRYENKKKNSEMVEQ